MPESPYCRYMVNLRVTNVPDGLLGRLRDYAREQDCTISEAVLTAVERELARWEARRRLAQRPPIKIGIDAAALVREGREARNRELEGRGTDFS